MQKRFTEVLSSLDQNQGTCTWEVIYFGKIAKWALNSHAESTFNLSHIFMQFIKEQHA